MREAEAGERRRLSCARRPSGRPAETAHVPLGASARGSDRGVPRRACRQRVGCEPTACRRLPGQLERDAPRRWPCMKRDAASLHLHDAAFCSKRRVSPERAARATAELGVAAAQYVQRVSRDLCAWRNVCVQPVPSCVRRTAPDAGSLRGVSVSVRRMCELWLWLCELACVRCPGRRRISRGIAARGAPPLLLCAVRAEVRLELRLELERVLFEWLMAETQTHYHQPPHTTHSHTDHTRERVLACAPVPRPLSPVLCGHRV